MEIYISNTGEKPIYAQITEQVKAQILSGELRARDALHPLLGQGPAHQRHHHQARL